jgi:hypothetical protein
MTVHVVSKYLTVKQACDESGLGRSRLTRYLIDERLKGEKILNARGVAEWRILRTDFEAWNALPRKAGKRAKGAK